MGCWNGTCMVSHLPIFHGDRVKAYAITPHWHETNAEGHIINTSLIPDLGCGYTYATDAWIPFPIGATAEYNDYGSIENLEEGEHTETIQKVTGKPALQFFDEAERVQDFDETGMMRGQHMGKYAIAMVHEKIWNCMMVDCPIPPDVDKIREEIEKLQSLEKSIAKVTEKEKDQFILRESLCMRLEYGAGHMALKEYGQASSPIDAITHLIFDGEAGDDTILAVRDTARFTAMLGLMRRGWFPQVGSGSQGERLDFHGGLAVATMQMVEELEKRWEE